MDDGALSDLRVLELGGFVSAPWCGKILASLGAEVIKVEPPGGDKARRAGPFPADVPHPEKSGLFLYLNTSKLSISLDVTQPTGRRLFLELVGQADVVLDNHQPQELEAWGLDYPHLREVNPQVILTSITPFGWEGPWAHYKGNDLVAFHTSGTGYETPFGYVTDPESEPPLKGAEYQADMTAGWTAASATMVALRHRQRFGEGQLVDVSAQEALANMVRPNVSFWSYTGDPRASRLKRGQRRAYACKDGYVSIGAAADTHWQNLVRMMGDPEWAQSELFATRESRMENADAVDALMDAFTADYTKAELFEMAQREHIPLFSLNDVAELLALDQYRHRGFWHEVAHPLAGTYQYPGNPYHFSATPAQTPRPAPLLGQHNEEVFCHRLGYSREDLRDLHLAGVIQRPGSGRQGGHSTSPRRPEATPHALGQAVKRLPLEGIRVVDFGLILAIPHATQWLATMGAEVIKVESKVHPDLVRAGGAVAGSADGIPGPNRSGTWNSLHYSKKTCSINMTKERGRELASQLIATADIVTENYTTPVTQRFGLTYEKLTQVKPDIILFSQSSMGRSGPLKDVVGWGPTNQAYAGLPLLTGYEGGVPQSMGGTWPDYMIGVAGAFLLLAALHHRDLTGEGQFIDLSMCEMITAMIPQAVLDYQMNGRLHQPQGNKDPLMVPHNVYRCAGDDEWVAIALETEQEWAAFCGAVGHPRWRTDERFADAYARHRNEKELDALITQWTRQRTPHEVTAWLQAAGVAAGPVLGTMGIINNPQLQHRGFFITPDHAEVGARLVMGTPVLYSAIPERRIEPAPLFDQDNDYVFKEILGLSGSKVEQLIEEEVLY